MYIASAMRATFCQRAMPPARATSTCTMLQASANRESTNGQPEGKCNLPPTEKPYTKLVTQSSTTLRMTSTPILS